MYMIAATGCQSGEVAVRSGDPVASLEVVRGSEPLVPGETLQLRAVDGDIGVDRGEEGGDGSDRGSREKGAIAECRAARPEWIWCDFVRASSIGFPGSVGMRARFNVTEEVNLGSLHVAFGKTPGGYFRPVDAGTEVYRDVYWRIYGRYEAGWVGGGGNKMSRAQSLATPQFAQAMIAHVWSGSSPEQPTINYIGIDPASGTGPSGRLATRSTTISTISSG